MNAKRTADGSILLDNRGKYTRKKTADMLKTDESIKNHISSIPRIESHYLRKNCNKEYISAELSQKEMYRLYLKYMDMHPTVKQATSKRYRTIMKTEFPNLSFFKPKKERCSDCEVFKNLKIGRDEGEHKVNRENIRLSNSLRGNFYFFALLNGFLKLFHLF